MPLLHLHTRIQFQGESDAQYRARAVAEEGHNRRAREEANRWRPSIMRGLEPWARKHAPELLEAGGLERMRNRGREALR